MRHANSSTLFGTLLAISLSAWLTAQAEAQNIRPPAPQWLVAGAEAALRDPLPSTRRDLLELIRYSSEFRQIPPRTIAIALGDHDSRVRCAAGSTLASLDALEYATEVARLLPADSDADRSEIAWALRRFAFTVRGSTVPYANDAKAERLGKAAIPSIIDLLRDVHPDIRAGAALALGFLNVRSAVPRLQSLLGDESEMVRAGTSTALALLQDTSSVPRLAELLADDHDEVREAARHALGALRASSELPVIAKLLSHRNPYVRISALRALATLGGRAQASRIARAVDDPYPDCRAAAIRVLSDLGDLSQAGRAAVLLGDPNAAISGAAFDYITSLRPESVKLSIAHLLSARQSATRAIAIPALVSIGGLPGLVDRLTMMLSDLEPSVRAAAARGLGGMRAQSSALALSSLLRDPDTGVRAAAADALVQIRATSEEEAIAKLLHDADPSLRSSAIRILVSFHATKYRSIIATLLTDSQGTVKRDAIAGLADLGATEAVPQLLELVDHDLAFAGFAAMALSRIGSRAHIDSTLRLLKSQDSSTRGMAAKALLLHGPLSTDAIPKIAESFYVNRSLQDRTRVLLYMLTGGAESVSAVLKRILLDPDSMTQIPREPSSAAETTAILAAFERLFYLSNISSGLRTDIERQVLSLVRSERGKLNKGDLEILTRIAPKMREENAEALEKLMEPPWWRQPRWAGTMLFIAVQIIAAFVLLCAYPRSLIVQSLLSTNIVMRRVCLLGIIEGILIVVPFFSRRALLSHRSTLVDNCEPEEDVNYFENTEASIDGGEDGVLLSQCVPRIEGVTIVEGASGRGKSMFLHRLVGQESGPAALLQAAECEEGVIAALALRLRGSLFTIGLIENLIRLGRLKVAIDGFNESSPLARQQVRRFVELTPHGGVIVASQPGFWAVRGGERLVTMRPLSADQMCQFLESRYCADKSVLSAQAYIEVCRSFVQTFFIQCDRLGSNELSGLLAATPLDLAIASRLLMAGMSISPVDVVMQQIMSVCERFPLDHQGCEFRMTEFASSVYSRHLNGSRWLDDSLFSEEIAALHGVKLALRLRGTQESDTSDKWCFRHQRIRDYFIATAMRLKLNGPQFFEQISDARFRSVYCLLLWTVPLPIVDSIFESVARSVDEERDVVFLKEVVRIRDFRVREFEETASNG